MGKLEYLSKAFNECRKVSEETRRPTMFHFADFMACYIRYGCLPRQYSIGGFYRMRGFDRKRILTYRKIEGLFRQLNTPSSIHILENKVDFNRYFSDFVKRGWLFPSEASAEELEEFLKRYGSVIVKPLLGVEGHGISKFVLSEHNGINYSTLKEKWEGVSCIIEQIIVQHPEMIFGNTSVNTIRPMTVLDRNGKAHVIRAVLRAGVGDNIVDNYNSGGVVYPLNVDGGFVDGPGLFRQGDGVTVHPGTDTMMLGYKIPNWNILIEKIKKAAEKITNCRFIGWDVAITDNDIELIEGNHNPDYEFYEFLNHPFAFEEIKRLI